MQFVRIGVGIKLKKSVNMPNKLMTFILRSFITRGENYSRQKEINKEDKFKSSGGCALH